MRFPSPVMSRDHLRRRRAARPHAVRSTGRRGYTVLEVVVTVAIASILLVALGSAVGMSDQAVRKSTGSHDSSAILKRIFRRIQQDVLQTSKSTIRVVSFGSPVAEGQALCVLSSKDVNGVGQFDNAGSPRWQRNILYYCITPSGHDAYATIPCQPAVGSWGLDDCCGHKILIRKEIDLSNPPSMPEDLMSVSQVQSATIAPNGTDLTAVAADPTCVKTEILGTSMLGMKVRLSGNELQVEVATVDLPRASKEIALGKTSLYSSNYVQSYRFSLIPEMP